MVFITCYKHYIIIWWCYLSDILWGNEFFIFSYFQDLPAKPGFVGTKLGFVGKISNKTFGYYMVHGVYRFFLATWKFKLSKTAHKSLFQKSCKKTVVKYFINFGVCQKILNCTWKKRSTTKNPKIQFRPISLHLKKKVSFNQDQTNLLHLIYLALKMFQTWFNMKKN